MDGVNKTLYIPLYGKSFVSQRGIILRDSKAEEIWRAESFPLRGKAKSKWLAYYMGMRSAVIDRWLVQKRKENRDAVVVHLGCGMDSRCCRVGVGEQLWFDVDFPQVIEERKKYYAETQCYRMVSGDIRSRDWLAAIPRNVSAIVVMEGISMYLQPQELRSVLQDLTAHFSDVSLLMDCYTVFAAKASKFKNPINEVGVTQVHGLDDPEKLASGTGICYVKEWEMTPQTLIEELPAGQQRIFCTLYAGKIAQKLYRLYEFCSR